MGLDPISVSLTKFQQLEILRQEEEDRAKEMAEVEKRIRNILWEMERLKYLQRVHPHYMSVKPPEEASALADLEKYRQSLGGALAAIKIAIQALEKELGPGVAAPPPGGSGQARRKYNSFEEFRRNR